MMREKSLGPDGTDFRFFRAFRTQVSEVLARSFTKAINEGLPDALRGGRTVLSSKGGVDLAQPAAYRPITLLPMAVRILHRVLDDLFRPKLVTKQPDRPALSPTCSRSVCRSGCPC